MTRYSLFAVPRIVALLLLGLTTGCGGAATPADGASFGSRPPQVAASSEVLALERQMFERVNRDRQAESLPPLVYDERLADVARAHSLDMKQAGFFAHESPSTGTLEDRLHVAGYLIAEARENLAYAPDVERAEDNLLRSPGHRANLMATTVTHVGVGIVEDHSQGAPMLSITQVFARPAVVASADELASGVLAIIAESRRRSNLTPIERDPFLDGLARAHLDEVPLDLDRSALAAIGRAVASDVARQTGHGLRAVDVVAQLLTEAPDFELPSSAKQAGAKRIGLATVAVTDEGGRPRVKLLALVGL
jgi:uncharacterized protein YkwD